MEYLTLGEKTFVKANKIAKDLGYTADYIGQLYRSGKVEAQLVGRTWYVEEASIKDHKRSRYRSVRTVAKRELHREASSISAGEVVAINTATTASVAPRKEPKYSKHRHSTLVTPQYARDDSELMPVLIKRPHEEAALTPFRNHSVPVMLADAEEIAISSESTTTAFEPTELPEIRFKGRLNVISADETEPALEEAASGHHTEELSPYSTP